MLRLPSLQGSIMEGSVAILVAILVCVVVSEFPEPLGSSRIFGGRLAKAGEFPFQVSIQITIAGGSWQHMCGGSIIDERHVLTAGHCLIMTDNPTELLIVAGELNVTATKDPERVALEVDQFYRHENFTMEKQLDNDIGLIRVKRGFPFNSVIKPIPMRNESVIPPAMCSTSGWGAVEYDPMFDFLIYPDLLQALDIPYVAQNECVAYYADYDWNVLPGMLCSGFIEGGPNPCSGDSGGGLICGGQLTGLVSWNRACWNETYLNVFTDVAYYHTWILEKLELSRIHAGL